MNPALHWKIRRDPYLSVLAERHGEDAVIEAGFFFDEDTEDAPLDDVDWRCTPAPRLLARSREPAPSHPNDPSPRRVVLLSTGAFNPIHDGHLEMMERARRAATTAGFEVVGGYLSPGHDAYLSLKCGPAAIPASVRLEECASRIEADPSAREWLSVDPWEALHRRVSVNYTDVAARLRAYLRHHFDPSLDVLYVCGGDNARFAYAFAYDGGCVVVGRPGSEAEATTWRERLAKNPRILFTGGDNPSASRTIRAAEWVDERKRRLVVRLEDMRALRTLSKNGDSPFIVVSWLRAFQSELIALIEEHATVRTANIRSRLPGSVDEQPDERDDDVISVDALLPARHNIAISRLYEVGGYASRGHVARPGMPALDEQIATIPPGKYVLRDDDAMTGSTLEAVRARLLPRQIEITKMDLAIDHEADEDVVDSRDFILGADDGGLVIMLGADIARAPYVLPYVDPSARASIRAREVQAFSKSIWALNERMFRGTGLRVRDLPPAARATFRFLGDDCLLQDVCAWHRSRVCQPPRSSP